MEVLKKSILKELDDAALKVLANALEKHPAKKDEILLSEGEKQEFAFIIEEGEVGCYKKQGDSEVLLNTLHSGAASGFFHIFKSDPSFSTLKVTSDEALIWKISDDDFRALIRESNEFLSSWLQYINLLVRRQSKALRNTESDTPTSDGDITVGFFDSSPWTLEAFNREEFSKDYKFLFFKERLDENTVKLASGCNVVCCFVNDNLNGKILRTLNDFGISMIALRCAGFDKVDVEIAKAYDLTIARVPAYSPYAVAEHAITLVMALNRRIHRAYQRTRDGNFDLSGLIGFDLHGKTVGVIGTGKIGQCLVNILVGFGCIVKCYDIYPCKQLEALPNVKYVGLDELLSQSDVISLHAPATKETHHLINSQSIEKMKKGVLIVNTSRGCLVDNGALLKAIKSGHVGAVGLDVVEGEADYFFKDNSGQIISDDCLRELLALPNVIVTGHQAFLTREALDAIANTTMDNIKNWKQGKKGKAHPNSIYQ